MIVISVLRVVDVGNLAIGVQPSLNRTVQAELSSAP
jgi:hypothetical protein